MICRPHLSNLSNFFKILTKTIVLIRKHEHVLMGHKIFLAIKKFSLCQSLNIRAKILPNISLSPPHIFSCFCTMLNFVSGSSRKKWEFIDRRKAEKCECDNSILFDLADGFWKSHLWWRVTLQKQLGIFRFYAYATSLKCYALRAL